MKRKLIRQGAGGYTIYLPKKWVEDQNLAASDEIIVEPLEGNLLLSAHAQDQKRITKLALTHMSESVIRTLITNAYRSGYDLINISFEKEEQFTILKEVINGRLLGFEITKHDPGSCIVENITEPAAEQFETLLRKVLFSITELFDITQQRLDGGKADFEEVAERIQKYDNFCRRIIVKETIKRRNSEMLWTFLALIVHAQRDLYYLNKFISQKTVVSKKTRLLFDETRELFDLVKRAYIERKVELLGDVHEKHQEVFFKTGYKLLEESNGRETVVVHHLLAALRQFYQATSPLAGWLV